MALVISQISIVLNTKSSSGKHAVAMATVVSRDAEHVYSESGDLTSDDAVDT